MHRIEISAYLVIVASEWKMLWICEFEGICFSVCASYQQTNNVSVFECLISIVMKFLYSIG